MVIIAARTSSRCNCYDSTTNYDVTVKIKLMEKGRMTVVDYQPTIPPRHCASSAPVWLGLLAAVWLASNLAGLEAARPLIIPREVIPRTLDAAVRTVDITPPTKSARGSTHHQSAYNFRSWLIYV